MSCIDNPELRGNRAYPVPTKTARDYLNGLVAGEKVFIRLITKGRYGITVLNSLSGDSIFKKDSYL